MGLQPLCLLRSTLDILILLLTRYPALISSSSPFAVAVFEFFNASLHKTLVTISSSLAITATVLRTHPPPVLYIHYLGGKFPMLVRRLKTTPHSAAGSQPASLNLIHRPSPFLFPQLSCTKA